MTMCPLFLTSLLADWALLVSPSLTCLEDLLSLFSTLSKAHLGYLHLVRAFLRWSFSCWSNSGLLHTVKALWERVWITLNLAERWWWLSHCKYWSVCRNIKQSIYIRVNNPTLNNNICKFNLSHIWDRVLLNTKGLTLNNQGNSNNNQLTNPH